MFRVKEVGAEVGVVDPLLVSPPHPASLMGPFSFSVLYLHRLTYTVLVLQTDFRRLRAHEYMPQTSAVTYATKLAEVSTFPYWRPQYFAHALMAPTHATYSS